MKFCTKYKQACLRIAKTVLSRLNALRVCALPVRDVCRCPPRGYIGNARRYFEENSGEPEASIHNIHPETTETFQLPENINDEIHWKFRKEERKTCPCSYVTRIERGRIWGDGGCVITAENLLLAEMSPGRRGNHWLSPAFRQWRLPPVQSIAGSVAVLAYHGAGGYFHWVFNVLPRLHLIKESPFKPDYYYVQNNRSFQVETLKLLGVDTEKVIPAGNGTHLHVERLLLPSPAQHIPNRWTLTFLRQLIPATQRVDTPRRIFLSRAKANCRRILNEEEVLKHLTQWGFVPLRPEEMPVSEQAALFAGAEMIVAPHGAGLSNLVFCQPGTKILEFFSPNYVNVCYWTLARQLDLDYWYQIGEGEKPAEHQDPHLAREDICVDIGKIEDSLSRWGLISH